MSVRQWDLVHIVVCPVADRRESFGKVADYMNVPTSVVRSRFEHLELEKATSFLHWAVQVRHVIYDVSGFNAGGNGQKDRKALREYDKNSVRDWMWMRDRYRIPYRRVPIGITFDADHVIAAHGERTVSDEVPRYYSRSWSLILTKAQRIWEKRFKGKYELTRSNCQNFAYCLLMAILTKRQVRETLDDTKQLLFDEIPKKITDYKKNFIDLAAVYGAMAGLGSLFDKVGNLAEAFGWKAISKKRVVLATLGIIAVSGFAMNRKGKDDRWMSEERMAKRWQDLRQTLSGDSMSDLSLEEDFDDYGGYSWKAVDWYAKRGFDVSDIVLVLQRLGLDAEKTEGYYIDVPDRKRREIFAMLRGEHDVVDYYEQDFE